MELGSDTFSDFVTECINDKTGNELLERTPQQIAEKHMDKFLVLKCIEQIENTYDGYSQPLGYYD